MEDSRVMHDTAQGEVFKNHAEGLVKQLQSMISLPKASGSYSMPVMLAAPAQSVAPMTPMKRRVDATDAKDKDDGNEEEEEEAGGYGLMLGFKRGLSIPQQAA